ncbi:FAS1 domain-containing protein [Microdochium trichocladiopsis]|uniref:FAS1 domain-containing protein n=1 Tax=Microdochium trichocladiopsis TaxID=1682393 RepID=A0A9P8YG37_9PEZI|nr:FAS1 domain-containing protein [Microdochium trichocladiopsis]KAH7037298.1 FAS1 domain-containing protein [Microdochium trichocladiopsis]
MRYSAILPLAAAASAIVIPDDVTLHSLVIEETQHVEDSVSSWWHTIPSADDIRNSVSDILSGSLEAVERKASKLHDYILEVEFDFFGSDEYDDGDDDEIEGPGHGRPDHPGRRPHHRPHRGHRGHHGHGPSNLTIYEAIQASNYTKKFAKLVDDFPDIVKVLNSTKANYTLFAPIDKAFDKIPEHHKKPSKEFLEKILEYHVVPGFYPAGRVLAGHTFPTLLKEEALGGRHQRLRVHLSLFGLRINFYSKIIAANLFFKNGVVHGIESILVPPPPAEKIVSLLPGEFSTLLLAAEKTGLRGKHDEHKHETSGLTIFAPTNTAFRRLGPAANAFLFNSEKGLKYLKALLKYHIVVNETLYSDAYYGRDHHDKDEKTVDGQENGHFHVDLPTLLGDRRLSIDIARWYGLIEIKINGFTRVAVQDGVAKDGVIHALQTVLIPPHEQKGFYPADTEISVEDLVEYLGPYVVEDDETREQADWFGEL